MRQVIVSLKIDADEYLKLYRGTAKSVYTHGHDGQSIRFPANILQPFVTRDGVKGTFRIVFDKENRFQYIESMDLQ
ncbi:MAG: DUF2835 domain-containing protein [Pseudomonadota bacterium]